MWSRWTPTNRMQRHPFGELSSYLQVLTRRVRQHTMSASLEGESTAYEVKCKGQTVQRRAFRSSCSYVDPSPLTIYHFFLAPQHAVTALNGLQTNAAVLEQIRRSGVRHPKEMSDMLHFLARTNMKVRTNNHGCTQHYHKF